MYINGCNCVIITSQKTPMSTTVPAHVPHTLVLPKELPKKNETQEDKERRERRERRDAILTTFDYCFAPCDGEHYGLRKYLDYTLGICMVHHCFVRVDFVSKTTSQRTRCFIPCNVTICNLQKYLAYTLGICVSCTPSKNMGGSISCSHEPVQ